MPEIIADETEQGKPEPETLSVKKTILFTPSEWGRVEAAARKLSSEIHTEVSEPEFVRGALTKRCAEVLGVA